MIKKAARVLPRLIFSLIGGGKSVSSHSFSIFSYDLVGFAIGMVTSILLARFFGPEGRGAISMVLLIPNALAIFADVGLSQASTYFTARSREKARNYLISLLLLSVISSGALLFAAYAGFDYWHKFYKSYPAQLFLIAMPGAFFLVLTSISRYFFLGLKQVKYFGLIALIQSLGNLIVTVVVGLFLEKDLRMYFILWLSLIVSIQAVFIIFIWRFVRREHGPVRLILKDVLFYGLKLYPANIVFFLRYRIDQFIIGYYLDPATLGIYTVSVFLSENLLRFPAAVQNALFPRISADQSDNKNEMLVRTLRVSTLLMILAVVLMAATGYPLIWLLFGKKFLPAYPALLILLAAVVGDSIWKIVGTNYVGGGRPGIISIFSFISMASNALFCFLLIPQFHQIGAGLSRLVSAAIISMLGSILFSRETKISLSRMFLPTVQDWQILREKFSTVIKNGGL